MFQPLSIIVPVLDQASRLPAALAALQGYRQRGHELIVVDGGSRDGSLTIARRLVDRLLLSGPGLAPQCNAGAESASHEVLLFLQATTSLPERADELIAAALRPAGKVWGCFALRLAGSGAVLRLIETGINWNSALSGIARVEQAIFVSRPWFEKAGCFAGSQSEYAVLSRKLLQYARPQRITRPVLCHDHPWQQGGVVRTLLGRL